VGATTTLLVERIADQGVVVSPIEATLFMLGIYEDTGALSYGTTTPRDLRAAAWLLEHSANMLVVNNFCTIRSRRATGALQQLADNCQPYQFHVIRSSSPRPR